jgi:phosphatidylglycerol:prolipoprotein diacylglycerol transferase
MIVPYPHIPPVAFRVGSVAVRWYGIMYVIGYVVGTRLAKIRSRRGLWTLTAEAVDTLVGYLLVGMFLGARLVYVTVYDWPAYRAHPLNVFAVWNGGLSFHGAALGMALACGVFAHRRRVPWRMVTDGVAVCAPPGLFFGRLGNFINAELYGRPTTLPWAMIFPSDLLQLPRHPSQLYEALGEGIILGAFLWWLQARIARRTITSGQIRDGYLTAAFLIGYGALRFLVEFTRQPDQQLGFVLGPFSMGQLLSTLTILAGLVLLDVSRRRAPRTDVSVGTLRAPTTMTSGEHPPFDHHGA